MEKAKVALVKCSGYEEDQVYQAVKKGVDLLGGTASFVKPGERIVLKPNVLIGASPERCVGTHPAVFKAVGRLLQEAEAKVITEIRRPWSGSESNLRGRSETAG
jgi:uncharacterized protein (DUF362 family)